MSTVDKMSIFLAEFIGTALLVFLGCMGCVSGLGSEPTPHLLTAIAFGLVVMMIIQIFGCVSGAHLNPAVTVGAYIYKHVTLVMAGVYILAQMLGAIVGYALLSMVTPLKFRDAKPGLCVTLPNESIEVWQGAAVEFLATACLMFAACGVWDPRNAKNTDSIPLRFGLVVAGLALVVGPYTGCSMNPARSFAPALWNRSFDAHWIYWIAPLAAGAIIPVVYKAVFWREAEPERKPQREEIPLNDKNGV